MKRALTIAFATTLVAAFVVWNASRTSEAAPPDRVEQHDATTTDNDEASAEIAGPAKTDPSPEREQVETPTAITSPDEAILRGRCVDEAGHPLAGVTVDLDGWVANDERLDAYRRDHGDVVWVDPENLITASDGRFEVRFVPPPPYQFMLNLTHTDRIHMYGRWGAIEPGTIQELGDVVLARGVQVSGRVLDVDGVPQREVRVSLDSYNWADRRTEIRPREMSRALTAANGTFRMRHPLGPGTWRLRLRGAQLAEPRKEFELELPATALELVVHRAADVVAIRGIVVDENGSPVRGAQVEPADRRNPGWIATSKRDGTFQLEKRSKADPGESFQLRAECEGYEHNITADAFEWGAENVRLVLRAGVDVNVYVRRADDGTAVEEFGLRVFPKPGSGRRSSRDMKLRGGWKHENGHRLVKGVRRGMHWVIAEPRRTSGLGRADPVEVEVRDGPPVTVEVRLPVVVSPSVAIRRAGGSSIAGSKVELLDPVDGGPVRPDTRAQTIGHWDYRTANNALLVDEATTDATGACSLRGTPDREYSLRVSGPTHPLFVRSGVQLGDQPIEIVVPTGATLRVTLRPIELLGDLREQAGLPRTGAVPKTDRYKLPRIRLQRRSATAHELFPPTDHRNRTLFDDGGVATLRGIPPGTWELQLATSISHGNWSSANRRDTVRTGLVLRDGEQTSVDLELPDARLGRLSGRVTVNGKPHNGQVEFSAAIGVGHNGAPRTETRYAEADENGAFEVVMPPGTWRAGPWVRVRDDGIRAYSDSAVRVSLAQKSEANFDVRIGRVKIRLPKPDGEPADGVQLYFQRNGEPISAHCAFTDSRGRTTATAVVGDAVPLLRPRRLEDPKQLRAYLREHGRGPDPMLRAMISLPPVLISEGEPREIEIRLPPAWDK